MMGLNHVGYLKSYNRAQLECRSRFEDLFKLLWVAEERRSGGLPGEVCCVTAALFVAKL